MILYLPVVSSSYPNMPSVSSFSCFSVKFRFELGYLHYFALITLMRAELYRRLSRLTPLKSGTLESLPEHIVSAPTLQSFRRHLKTFLTATVFLPIVDLDGSGFGYLGHVKKRSVSPAGSRLQVVSYD